MLVVLAVVRWYPLVLACLAVGGWGMLLYFSTTNTLIQSSVHAVGVPWTITVGALICAGTGLVTWWPGRQNPVAPQAPE
jgi:hypothetical protein